MQTPERPTGNGGQPDHRGALRIALIYAAFASLWILLSDQAVSLLFKAPSAITQAGMIKGWLFVAVTGLLLYLLIARHVRQIQEGHRRETELLKKRQSSLDLLGAISDHSDDAIFAKDLDGRYILFNRAASRIIGKPASNVLGKDDRALFPAEQAKMLMDIDLRIVTSGRAETDEETLPTTQGVRTFLTTKGPLFALDGSIVGMFGISRDITERKLAELSLHETGERLRLMLDHSPLATAMFDRDMCYLIASTRWLMDFGLEGHNIIRRSHYAVFPEIDERFKDIHRRGLAGEVFPPQESRIVRADGCVQWLRWSQIPWRQQDGSIGGIVIFSEDMTDRKQAELALAGSEQRFHDIARASADWVWEVDTRNRYTYVSDGVETLLGYAPSEILGKTPFDFMPPEEATRVAAIYAAIAERKEAFRYLDNIIIHKDGSLRHVWTNGTPIKSPDGMLLGYRGLDHDITKRKADEIALRQLASDLATTLQAIPDLLFEIDAEGRYLDVKATREALLAAPADQVLGRKVSDVLPPEAAQTVMDAVAAARQVGTDYGRVIMLPLAHGTCHFEISIARKQAVADQMERYVVLSRDITARKIAEDELRQRNAELERFNNAMIGREMDVIEMKRTINAMSRELGREPPYPLAFMNQADYAPRQ